MSKKPRQKIKVLTEENLDSPAQMRPSELLKEHDKYDQKDYDPTSNLVDKEVLIPIKKSDVVTVRLTPSENQIISHLADENGLSKSAFIRMVVKKAIKQEEYQQQ